ncbi:MAG: hypothetical protein IKZ07_03875 [Akkermansia sp.]|nr:hypothetical protein [Akkermansia sp.]
MKNETPYQAAISALETLKDLLTPTVAGSATRIALRTAERRLAAMRTRPASVENCDAIAGEQQLIATLRHKLATAQDSAQLRTALHVLRTAAAALPGAPVHQPEPAGSSGMFDSLA